MPSICIFGDSVSKGIVLDAARKKYQFLKDSFVNLFHNKTSVPVTNYAKFGCTVTKGRDLVHRHAEELGGYTFTALEFGGNDCDFNWAEVSAAPDQHHEPKTPLPEFEQCYSDIIREVREKKGNPVLLSLPPLDAQRYFQWISQNLSPQNILRWLGDVHMIYRFHEMYNMAVCRLANRERVPLVDIRSAFLREHHYQNYLCEDGIHPNDQGHALISKTLQETYHAPELRLAFQF